MFPHMRALGDPTELSAIASAGYVGITRVTANGFLPRRARSVRRGASPDAQPRIPVLARDSQELIVGGAPSLAFAFGLRSAVLADSARTSRLRPAQRPENPASVAEPGVRHPRQVLLVASRIVRRR